MNITYYAKADALMSGAKEHIVETDVVLDIGCGIVPMNYFRPKFHIMVEPWHEYSDVLWQRHREDKSVLILSLGALECLSSLKPNSVDSIFLLDVIEHLEKDVGQKVLIEIERVCRRQAVIFTPLGFMPQHMEDGENDAWGLSGVEMQEHKSGWLPEDFSDGWEFLVCDRFHLSNYNGDQLENSYGAFFAIRNFSEKTFPLLEKSSDLRRPLPSELRVDELTHELFLSRIERSNLRISFDAIREEVLALSNAAGTFGVNDELLSRTVVKIAKHLSFNDAEIEELDQRLHFTPSGLGRSIFRRLSRFFR